jgi:hypothetical protein
VTAEQRVTYRSVLSNREFAAIAAGTGLSVLGDQLARIAIAVLVYQRTNSAFAASATYAISYLTYLLGGPLLSALSDRYRRLTVMVVCDVARAPLLLALCLPGVPLWCVFAVLIAVGALAPPFDSARSGLQPDILPGDAYVVGSAILNLIFQTAQVLGLVAGGALVALISVRGALALDAASFLISGGLMLAAVMQRPPAQRKAERSTLYRDTLSGLRLVTHTPQLRRLLAYALLGSAAVIAPEGLAVPVARSLGGGALEAGLLTASVPAGFLVASGFVLRVDPERRTALLPWLALLGCVPLLFTAQAGSPVLVGLLWFVAGAGGSVNLIASAAFIQACPREFRSRAYGVAVTSLYAVQGLVLLLAGALAGPLSATQSVAAMALLTLVLLGVMVARDKEGSQGNSDLVRSTSG